MIEFVQRFTDGPPRIVVAWMPLPEKDSPRRVSGSGWYYVSGKHERIGYQSTIVIYEGSIGISGPDTKYVQNGVVEKGTIAEQLAYESMVKHLPRWEALTPGKLHRRVLELP